MKFSWLGKSSLAPAAGGAGVILVAVVLAVLGAGDTGAKVSRNKINPLLALASDHPRPDLLVLLPATAKVVASKLVAVVPGVAARAAGSGACPAGLGRQCPAWPAVVPGMEAFVPPVSSPMKIVFSVSILGGLLTNTKEIWVGSLIPLVLVVQFPFGVLRRPAIWGSWPLR